MKTVSLTVPAHTMTLPIRKAEFLGGGRSGTLLGILSTKQITDVLGFGPTRFRKCDTDGKVTMEWKFEIAGQRLAIWDYKGSAKDGQFSTGGDPEIFAQLFPNNYKRDR